MMKIGIMALYTAILIASSLAVHSMAMPLSPYDAANGAEGGENHGQLRSKRSGLPPFPVVHDYVKTTYIQRISGCQGAYSDCTPVLPHVCDSSTIEFNNPLASDARTEPRGCELTVTVNLTSAEIDSIKEVEIAFFKKIEPMSFGRLYFPFIFPKLAESQIYGLEFLAEAIIPSSCSGWQTFNISNISSILTAGGTTFNLLFAVFSFVEPNNIHLMTCEEIESLFVMDTYANIDSFFGDPSEPSSTTETPTEESPKNTTTEAKKEDNNSSIDTPNKTAITKKEEGGSGDGTMEEEQTTSTVEKRPVKAYIPSIAFFIDALPFPYFTKRSVDDVTNNNTTNKDPVPTEEEMLDNGDDQASGDDCRRLEKKIKLSDIDPTIAKPEIIDIGECSSSTESMQCLPSATSPVHIVKKNSLLNTATFEYFPQKQILACEPHFIPTEASTADQASTATL